VPTRLRSVLDEAVREREAMKVESEIRDKVQSDIGKSQRDYMLRQQLDAIRSVTHSSCSSRRCWREV